MMGDKDIKDLLDFESQRINNVGFIDKDPVQFPRRFSSLQDIEIVSFLSAMIAWGNRKMICRNCEKMLKLMNNEPYLYVMEEGYEDLDPDLNIHRTFFGRHFQYFLRGMRHIYKKYDSLDEFTNRLKCGKTPLPAWSLIENMQKILRDVNGGENCSRCFPTNLSNSALKRVNMALRWLVRDDGIVDLGVWRSIRKDKLYIPLDVHVGNVSRELGLLSRKANDKKSVEELTEVLRTFRPEDPVVYDFALFGLGIERVSQKEGSGKNKDNLIC